MKILICGGRNYARLKGGISKEDRPAAEALAGRQRIRMREVLAAATNRLGMTSLIVDDGLGAAAIAAQWAAEVGIPCEVFAMDKATYGKTAEPVNHERMIAAGKPDAVMVFPGKWETEDLIEKAREAGLRIYEIDRA